MKRFLVAGKVGLFCGRSIIEFMSALEKHPYWLFLFILLTYTACEPPNEVGVENFAEESFDLFPVDTMTIEWTTYKEDSIVTDLPERLLIGRGEDHIFGSIEARPYFQFGVDTIVNVEDDDNLRYDSITLAFELDGYSYFDTLKPTTLSLYQISEEFETEDGYFNTTSFPFDSLPLGSKTFIPRPHKEETLEIKLDDGLGRIIWKYFLDESAEVILTEEFIKEFPGWVLIPNSIESSNILGLVPEALQLRLYYTDLNQLPPEDRSVSFSVADGVDYFNQITGDFEGSELAIFSDSAITEFTATRRAPQSYVRGGDGIGVKVTFPHIKNLLQDYEDFVVSNAILRFSFLDDPGSNQDQPPETLISTIVNRDDNGLIRGNTDNATLQFDEEFRRDSYYEVDVTQYVKDLLVVNSEFDTSLALRVQFLASSVDRVIIGPVAEV
ncbi:MAG: DUF4270 family protein, partial [Bacteroidota bacterium]